MTFINFPSCEECLACFDNKKNYFNQLFSHNVKFYSLIHIHYHFIIFIQCHRKVTVT